MKWKLLTCLIHLLSAINASAVKRDTNAVLCPMLTHPEHGAILQTDRSLGGTATTVCDEGYIPMEHEATTRHCQQDNTWSGKAVNCTRKPCEDVNTVDNGILSAQGGKFGDKITLQCNSGYIMDGISTITCEASGNWDSVLGNCQPVTNNLILLVVLVPTSVFLFCVIMIVFYIMTRLHRPRVAQRTREQRMPVMDPLLEIESPTKTVYFTFVFAEELGHVCSTKYGYDSFTSDIRQQLTERPGNMELHNVELLHLCKSSRRGFLSVTTAAQTNERQLAVYISNSPIRHSPNGETLTFHITLASIISMDKIQCALSAQIIEEKHLKDVKCDNRIDFNSQYVKLKLQSETTLSIIQRDVIERPDQYQNSLRRKKSTEVEDEDLIKANDFEKYVLLRGRAGIGKSTLMQRLLWKWANGEWAIQFKAIFLFNLRLLINIKKKVDLANLINKYSVYSSGRSDLSVDTPWLMENEMHISFVLDGVDEVCNFRKYWKESRECSATAEPIRWCFALMARELFPKSTLIVSSRPFADLGLIARTLSKKVLSSSLNLVQLMGLTHDRVRNFINKNVQSDRRDFVWQTLVKNPILMSISSITFYCAALCKILVEQKDVPTTLKTYSQITAYIMESFIQRSMRKADEGFQLKEILQTLSELAFKGLVREIDTGHLRLLFDDKDFADLRIQKDVTHRMTETGLLMKTEILDPTDKEKSTVLSQFVHLMIQEFLAMAGLLSQSAEEFKQLLDKLGSTQQFSMAIIFLYGLAFDDQNEMLRGLQPVDRQQKRETLKLFAKGMQNKLQALQVAHESQSPDVAHAVGKNVFKDGCLIENTKLTLIDILALTFVLEHNPSLHRIRLERGELDMVSVKRIATFLMEDSHIEELCIVDDTLDDACIQELMSALRKNSSLKMLQLHSDNLTDTGMGSVKDTLIANKTLRTLHLSSYPVTDNGILQLAKALQSKTELESLRFMFRKMTDEGLQNLLRSLEENKSLKELLMIEPSLTDAGISAIGHFLPCSSLKSLRVDCSGMTNEGVKMIADSLPATKLEKLWLHSRKLTDVGVQYLMEKLRATNTLTEIQLSGKTMKEDAVKAVLTTVSCNPKLLIRMKKPIVPPQLLDMIQSEKRIKLQ